MQKEQNLLQPSIIGTKATYLEWRATEDTSHDSPSPRSPKSISGRSPFCSRSINDRDPIRGSRSHDHVNARCVVENSSAFQLRHTTHHAN